MCKKFLAAALSALLCVSQASVFADTESIVNKASYSDVSAEAECFDSVELLCRLGIMEGYEGNTFKPEGKVTRAEISKMIICALGENAVAQAESATGHDTIFSDVTATHWASGYIAAAVSNNIINGMGNGTFAPEENVTYKQAMKMLVCAAGYSQWSVDRGGWPDGYMYWGSHLKIGAGIKDITTDTPITRAQTAVMIKNAMCAPLCVDTHDYTYDMYGNKYAKLECKDSSGAGWQTLLTYRNIYEVKGYLSKPGVFTITSAKNLDNEYYPAGSERNINIHTSYDADSVNKPAKAYIQASDNGDYSIIYMQSAPADDVKE